MIEFQQAIAAHLHLINQMQNQKPSDSVEIDAEVEAINNYIDRLHREISSYKFPPMEEMK